MTREPVEQADRISDSDERRQHLSQGENQAEFAAPLLSLLRELVEELVVVVQESTDWAQANGFPAVSDYPQYARIRALGQEINEAAGFRGMQAACQVLKSRIRKNSPGGESWPAEKAWEGIDGWMP